MGKDSANAVTKATITEIANCLESVTGTKASTNAVTAKLTAADYAMLNRKTRISA